MGADEAANLEVAIVQADLDSLRLSHGSAVEEAACLEADLAEVRAELTSELAQAHAATEALQAPTRGLCSTWASWQYCERMPTIQQRLLQERSRHCIDSFLRRMPSFPRQMPAWKSQSWLLLST